MATRGRAYTAACVRPSLSRSEPGIGKVEPLDEDANERAVELAPAVGRRMPQIPNLHAHDAGFARRGDTGTALMAAQGKVSHLAEAFARTEHREQLLVLGDVHVEVADEEERGAGDA